MTVLGADVNNLNKQRELVGGQIRHMLMPKKEGGLGLTPAQVVRNIMFMTGQYASAAKAGDGSFKAQDNVLVDNPLPIPFIFTGRFRGQSFENMTDFINFINTIDPSINIKLTKTGRIDSKQVMEQYGVETSLLSQSSKTTLAYINKNGIELFFEKSLAEATEARNLIKMQMEYFTGQLKNKKISKIDLALLMASYGSSMRSPLRRAANVKYIWDGAYNVPKNLIGSELEYEHIKPQNFISIKLLDIYLTENKLENRNDRIDAEFNNYHVAIIPKKMEEAITEVGRKFVMQNNYVEGGNVLGRYYDMVTYGHKDMVALTNIDPAAQGQIVGQSHERIANKIQTTPKRLKDTQIRMDARKLSLSSKQPTKGISVWDFDDTLASTKSGVLARIPNKAMSPKPQRKVIFLAGGPGSGKSTVIKNLGLEKQGFKIVNQDISLQWLAKNHGLPTDMRDFTPEQRSKWGSLSWEARDIAKRKKIKFQGRGDGIIVDGTGASKTSMTAQVNEFKRKGYDVSMVFVETSLETALTRNKARKERSLIDSIVKRTWSSVMENKKVFKEMFGNNFVEINTDNLKQNDPLPLKAINKMDTFTKSYAKERLTAEQFAIEGAAILERGGEFDFSEFEMVREGQPGPFFEKFINRMKKYGPKDNFILTARPKESAPHIHMWLKMEGYEIPLKNITALGNSTAEAKALWILEKVGEGYNDFYFADDAIKNVEEVVQSMLDQVDVKSKVQQARYKFSNSMNKEFNNILEQTTKFPSFKKVSGILAQRRGDKVGKYKFFVPPSAEDFSGLLYAFYTKGKLGEKQKEFFKKALLEPYAIAMRGLNSRKQTLTNDYGELKKTWRTTNKILGEKIPEGDYTYEQAIRVFLYDKAGYEIPAISNRDRRRLVSLVSNDANLEGFANGLSLLLQVPNGYVKPGSFWLTSNIEGDIYNYTQKEARQDALAEWKENKDIIFSPDNLNKIQYLYGSNFREALEDILWRMEHGTNRNFGQNRLVNNFSNWVNNSVGAIMFFNMRSAALQTISSVNYLNWSDNNPYKAAVAFSNIKQFAKDFSFIFNSDMLKQRRGGLQQDVNANEIANVIKGQKNKVGALLNYLLRKGFLPTQIADSFAISSGGATFYRNRIKTYIKKGMTQAEAESKAWLDFQEITEANQQSSRPDLISQQQASSLGRLVLAFQNTPMQYTRIIKKAILDLAAGRGDAKTHISKILYYGAIQNFIFTALQSALFAVVLGDDDDDYQIKKKEQRIANNMIDTILRGTGVSGAVVSTIKNMIIAFLKEEEKEWRADHAYTLIAALNLSPPIGSKARKLYSATQTWEYNRDVIPERGFSLDNPGYQVVGNVVSAITNFPLDRLVNKANNLSHVLNDEHAAWQRMALLFGYNTWDIGIRDEDIEQLKKDIKKRKKEAKNDQKKTEEAKVKEAEGEKKQEKEKKEGKKITCLVCKLPALPGQKYCTIHEKKPQREDGKKVKCKGFRTNGSPCGMTTSNKSGYCYYHD